MNIQSDHSTKRDSSPNEEEQQRSPLTEANQGSVFSFATPTTPRSSPRENRGANGMRGIIGSMDAIQKELDNLCISGEDRKQDIDTLGKELDGMKFVVPKKNQKIKKKKREVSKAGRCLTKLLRQKKISIMGRIAFLSYFLFNKKSFLAQLIQELKEFFSALDCVNNVEMHDSITMVVGIFDSVILGDEKRDELVSLCETVKQKRFLEETSSKLKQAKNAFTDFSRKYFSDTCGLLKNHDSKNAWQGLSSRVSNTLVSYNLTVSCLFTHVDMLEKTCALQKNKMQNWSNYKEHQLSSN